MNKKILVVLVLIMTLSLTGCTKYMKDDEGKVVKEPTTGQSLASNIICQPEDKNVIKTYEKNDVKIEKLPTCQEFTPASGGYEGIWSTLVIKPLSWLIIFIGDFVKNYGLAIIIVTLLIRLIIFPISKKSAMQSENMKKASKDMKNLENKYRNRDDKDAQMLKAQEMMQIYKKHNINPMSGCIFAFIQMPLFLAFLESLQRIPAVFEGTFLGFNLGTSPFNALFGETLSFEHLMNSFSTGNWLYILLPITVALATFFSFKMNSGMGGTSPDQEKQMKMMMNIMLIFIVFASFTMSSSIVIYWITGSLFTILQSIWLRRKKDVGNSEKRSKEPKRSTN